MRGTHFDIPSRPQARPFDEFLMGNPVGNPGNAIYSSGNNSADSPQQYQPFANQSNTHPRPLPHSTLQMTQIIHSNVFVK
jgi:hypothetical protein